VGLPWPRHSRYSFRPPISTRPEKSPVATGEAAAKVAPCAAVACHAGPAGRMPTRKRTNTEVKGWRSMMFSEAGYRRGKTSSVSCFRPVDARPASRPMIDGIVVSPHVYAGRYLCRSRLTACEAICCQGLSLSKLQRFYTRNRRNLVNDQIRDRSGG
jgi:hypothetical protein